MTWLGILRTHLSAFSAKMGHPIDGLEVVFFYLTCRFGERGRFGGVGVWFEWKDFGMEMASNLVRI